MHHTLLHVQIQNDALETALDLALKYRLNQVSFLFLCYGADSSLEQMSELRQQVNQQAELYKQHHWWWTKAPLVPEEISIDGETYTNPENEMAAYEDPQSKCLIL